MCGDNVLGLSSKISFFIKQSMNKIISLKLWLKTLHFRKGLERCPHTSLTDTWPQGIIYGIFYCFLFLRADRELFAALQAANLGEKTWISEYHPRRGCFTSGQCYKGKEDSWNKWGLIINEDIKRIWCLISLAGQLFILKKH